MIFLHPATSQQQAAAALACLIFDPAPCRLSAQPPGAGRSIRLSI